MSACNWDPCPTCVSKHHEMVETARGHLKATYGEMPIDQWLELKAAVDDLPGELDKETWREDWEIGISASTFYASYSGGCRECGAKFEWAHECDLPGGAS